MVRRWKVPTASKGTRNHSKSKKPITSNNTASRKEETTQAKKRIRDNEWKLGTWNIRGLAGKEHELSEEFTKTRLDVLTITETKKRGKGRCVIDGNHVL